MGWISDTITLVRDFANEGEVNAKWTGPKVILLMEKAFGLVTPEIFRNADGPNSVRLSVVTTSGTLIYTLPPNVAEIIRVVKLSSDGRVEWRVDPRSRWNPAGVGLSIDSGNIRFGPTWNHNETLEIWYIPTGEVKLIEGPVAAEFSFTTGTTSVLNVTKTAAFTDYTYVSGDKLQITLGSTPGTYTITGKTNANTITVSAAPGDDAGGVSAYIRPAAEFKAGTLTTGTTDTRENAYAGYMVSKTDSSLQEDRIITTSTAATLPVFGVEPNWGTTPSTSGTFEVRPVFGDVAQMAVALRTALLILKSERMDKAIKFLEPEYASVMRELRLRGASKDQMVGQHFRGDTWGNDRFVNDAEDWRTQG